MMRFFSGLVLYMMIGGLFLSLGQQNVYDECDKDLSENTIAYATFAWPAVIIVGMIKPDFKQEACNGGE